MTKPGPEAILRAWRAAEHDSPAATGASPARGRALAATAVLGTVAAALLLQSPDSDGILLRAGRAGGLMGDQRGSHMQSVTTIIGAATVAIPLALSANASAQQGAAVQWRVEDGGNGHWYRVVNLAGTGAVDWEVSRAAARTVGGDLATFTSEAETNAFLALTEGQVRGNPWLGLFQDSTAPDFSEPAGGWRWVSGEPITWANWSSNEPNNAGNENWAIMWIDYGPRGTWNDYLPTDPQGPDGYVIEWSEDCNGDGVVDYGQCRDGTLPDYDGDNTPDCCERGEVCVVGNYPMPWRAEDGGNGHWYQVLTSPSNIDWFEAGERAADRGGLLVSITSNNENAWIHSLAVNTPGAWGSNGHPFWTFGPWIGASKPQASVPWRWVSSESWTYAAWYSGQPDSSQPSVACFGCSGSPQAAWSDEEHDAPVRSYVVEWSADCNNDGIVDYGQILQGQLADANANGIPDLCEVPTCADADLNPNGTVDGADLGALLAFWGPVSLAFPRADINGDGTVNGADLGILLSVWGPCGS